MTTPRAVTVTTGEQISARIGYVGPRYAEVMRLRRLAGALPEREEVGGELVKLIVDQSVARQTGGERDAVGRRITLDRRPAVIAAVIQDVAHTSIGRRDAPLVLALTMRPQSNLVVRLDPAGVDAIPAIRAMFLREFPGSHMRETIVLDDLIAVQLTESRGRTVLLGAIGLLCLPVAATGLAGSVALAVRRRRREIAVRMAFGAAPGQVRRLVTGGVLVMATTSIVAGLVLGYRRCGDVPVSVRRHSGRHADGGRNSAHPDGDGVEHDTDSGLAHARRRSDAVAAGALISSVRRCKRTSPIQKNGR